MVCYFPDGSIGVCQVYPKPGSRWRVNTVSNRMLGYSTMVYELSIDCPGSSSPSLALHSTLLLQQSISWLDILQPFNKLRQYQSTLRVGSLFGGYAASVGYDSHSTRGNTLDKALYGHGLVEPHIHLYHPPNQMPLYE
ncbi:unnamed protein product [Rhizoctonia solani]|uniref:Uncharacterized protein n=1 Tax=Rhizoctonia solani TaxID=456999 RepID=A0A8H2XP14_9AGAM|nr:unnamed protein product [Rhizoctonia solani]